jgi:hypothetical protein
MVLTLTIGLLLLAALLIPGALVALTWRPEPSEDDTPLYHVLLGLGWSFGLVPFLAFTVVLFTKIPLEPAITLGVGAVVATFAGSIWWNKYGRTAPVQLTHGWKEAKWVLIASIGVGVVYLLKYDRSVFFLESCIHRVVMQTLHLTENPIDILASNADDQRLGNTAVISSFVVLFRGLGFRLLYAFVGFSIALGGYLLGRRCTGSTGWAWFVLFTLPLNPYVAKIPLLDENLLTLGFASLCLPLMLRKRTPWWHVGAMFGLVVMMRHVAILSGPAMLWAVWKAPGKRSLNFAKAFAAFNLVTIVGHIHHVVALGSLLKFESFGQIPKFPHRMLGEYSGLLQWPFGPELVRTPWNPLPTFLMWPTYLADHLGLVLFAALIIGIIATVKYRRDEGVFWLLWWALPYTALSLQENWDVPNKMGVIYILFHSFVIWAAMGLQAASMKPKRWAPALIVTAFIAGITFPAIGAIEIPDDHRYYAAWTGEREEDPAYVAAEKRRVLNIAPWPDYGRLGPPARVFHPGKFSGLLRDLKDPAIDQVGTPYGWFPGESIRPNDGSVVLELDFSRRLFDRLTPFVRLTNEPPDIDLSIPGPAKVIPNIAVDWSPRPMTVLLSRGQAKVTGLSLIFEKWGSDEARRAYLHERYHRGLQMVLGWSAEELLTAVPVTIQSKRVRIRVPVGPFSIIESVNNAGQNYFYWYSSIDSSSTLDVQGPQRVFHN